MSNRTVNISTSLSGNDPFLEIQSINTDHFQFGANSVLALADNVNLAGNLTVNGALNGATIDGNGITIAQLNATTDVETPKIIFPDNAAAGLTIQATDNVEYITLKSTNGQEQIQLNKTIFTAGNSLIHGSNNSRGTIQYSNLVNSTIAPSCTVNANAATATLLQNARTIGGVSFNGATNIDLPGVNTGGSQNTSGTAASWASARTTNFTSLAGDDLGSVSLSGTGTTTAQLKTPFYDESNANAKKLILSNTTSGHTSTGLQQRIDFANEFLPQMNQTDDLVGRLTMAKDVFSITQFLTSATNTSQATTFTRGDDSFPKMNGMLRFLQSAAGANISVERDGTFDGAGAQRALPSGIDFKLGSGTYVGSGLGGLQGGIRSNYTAQEVGNTKIFASSFANNASYEASLLLKPDELSLTNMGIIKFNGAGTISSTDSNIALTPGSGKQVILGTKVRVGSIAEAGDEEANPYLMGIEDPTPINGSETDDVAQLLSFKYHVNNGQFNRHFGFEGDQTTGGIQLVRNIFGTTANDGYTGTRTKTKLIQFSPTGLCSVNGAPLQDGLGLIQPTTGGAAMGFSHPNDTTRKWTFLVGSNYDCTFSGATGCNNLTMNGKARATLNAQGGIAAITGSTDVEITATSGDVKLTSDQHIYLTADDAILINAPGNMFLTANTGNIELLGRAEGGLVKKCPNSSTGTYSLGLQLILPGTTTGGFVIFQNGSARTADGGGGVATVRNDAGTLRLGRSDRYTHHVARAHSFFNTGYTYNAGAVALKRYATAGDWGSSSGATGDKITIHVEQGGIWIKENGAMYMVSSDERVKDEIEIVDDDEALNIILKLETKKYHYKDPKKRRAHKSIGFIAQDVMKHLPTACKLNENIIPDEMRELEDMEWVDNKLYLDLNLADNNTGKVRFSVLGQEVSADGVEDDRDGRYVEITRQIDDDGKDYYEFEKQHASVFVYGKEVNDFLGIDKQQIFGLHHSGIQQLDRNDKKLEATIVQQAEKIVSLETQLKELISRVSLNELALKSLL